MPVLREIPGVRQLPPEILDFVLSALEAAL